MSTNLYLVISDGTTTVTIADGAGGSTDYRLAYGEWAPRVAGLRSSELGGRGPFEDVIEEMLLHVYGSSAAAAYSNLQTLARLLDQAGRFARGENVAVVLVKLSPAGGTVSSTGSPLQAVCLGGAVQLSGDFNDLSSQFVIRNVKVTFARRGEWIHTDTTASSSSAANPNVLTATPTDHPTPSPTKFTLRAPASTTIPDGFFVVARSSSDIILVEAEAGTATGWTSQSDSTNDARGGSVLRYAPTGTTASLSGALDISSIRSTCKQIAVIAAVRNNSASRTFQLRVNGQVRITSGINQTVSKTPFQVIDNSTTNPRVLFLGLLEAPPSMQFHRLLFEASVDSITGSPTLDIDYVCLVALDDLHTRIIALDLESSISFSNAWDLVIDDLILSKLTPDIYGDDTVNTDTALYSWRGDALIYTFGATCAVCLLASNAASWVVVDGSSNPVSHSFTMTRHKAYLTPE